MADKPIFWVKWGGIKEVFSFFDVPDSLEYPISFNLPDISWFEGNEINLRPETDSLNLFIDLVYELGDNNCGNYKFCVGIFDNRFFRDDDKTVRGISVAKYYARFVEKYNVLSPKNIDSKQALNLSLYEVLLNKEPKCFLSQIPITKDFEFINGFSSLSSGDFVSLGTVCAFWSLSPKDLDSLEIRSPGFGWRVNFS